MNLSWSRYECYKHCFRQYHLRYQKHLRKPKLRAPFLVGNVVHKLMQDWSLGGFRNGYVFRNLRRVFIQESKGMVMTSKRLQTYAQRATKGAITAEKIYRGLGFTKHDVTVEKPFDIAFPGRAEEEHRIRGYTDVYDPETEAIYDLKMYTRQEDSPDPEQLYTYAVTQEKQGLHVAKAAFLLPLLKNPIRAFRVTPEHVSHQTEKLSEALDHMVAGVDPQPTPGFYCWFCEFRATDNCPETRNLRR